MLKMGRAMAENDALWHTQSFQLFFFEFRQIKVVVILTLVQGHVQKRTCRIFYGFKALLKALGSL